MKKANSFVILICGIILIRFSNTLETNENTKTVECPLGEGVKIFGNISDRTTGNDLFVFKTKEFKIRSIDNTALKLMFAESINFVQRLGLLGLREAVHIYISILYVDGQPKDCNPVPMDDYKEWYNTLDWYDRNGKNCLLNKLCEMATSLSRTKIADARLSYQRKLNQDLDIEDELQSETSKSPSDEQITPYNIPEKTIQGFDIGDLYDANGDLITEKSDESDQ